MKKILLLVSHGAMLFVGFALGIYLLPILTAPEPPSAELMAAAEADQQYTGTFIRDLPGSDFLHWGEGQVMIGKEFISLKGKVAPGPDYKLYLSPSWVTDEGQFEAAKASMVQVGDVKTFEDFVVKVPATVDPSAYSTVVVWCESFGEFITAAQYQ